jgi:hypothetical protein
MISALLLSALQSICLGQISSYTEMSDDGDSVVAYGAILDDYSMGTHINTTVVTLSSPSGNSAQSSGGDSATVWILVDADGYYTADTTHDSWCPYTQQTISPSGGSDNQRTRCVDTCTSCRASRQPKEVACLAALGTCEAAALVAYNNAMTACDNNNFCNPNHPQYNQQQCDNCRSTANENYAIATAACGGAFVGCRALITPDCDLPTYKKANCDQCDNFPPW